MNSGKIISKFRSGLFVQMGAIIVLGTVGAWYVKELLAPGIGALAYAVVFGMISVVLALLWWGFIKPMYRLEMDQTQIRRRHILTGEENRYEMQSLKSIETGVHQIENANGPLTEPVPEIYLEFNDGRSLELSPRIYDNFYEMAMFVARVHHRNTERKLEQLAEYLLLKKLMENGKQKPGGK